MAFIRISFSPVPFFAFASTVTTADPSPRLQLAGRSWLSEERFCDTVLSKVSPSEEDNDFSVCLPVSGSCAEQGGPFSYPLGHTKSDVVLKPSCLEGLAKNRTIVYLVDRKRRFASVHWIRAGLTEASCLFLLGSICDRNNDPYFDLTRQLTLATSVARGIFCLSLCRKR